MENIKNIVVCVLALLIIFFYIKPNNISKGGSNNFNILKKTNLKNKLLISTTLFIENIENIDILQNKYIKGLHRLYNWCLENNYILRIYFDESCAKYIIKEYLNKNNIELYKYYFPKFYLKNKKIHYGTFGTLIRFYPLFNIKEHYHNNTIIADSDFQNKLKSNYNNIIKFINNNKQLHNNIFISKSRFCYSKYKRFKSACNNKFPFMAGCLYNYNNKFDINILNKHIDKLDINQAIYGCDEWFINETLFKTFKQNINMFSFVDDFRKKGIISFDHQKNNEYYKNRSKIYYKCEDIFNNYIKKNKKNIDIINFKQVTNDINKIKNIFKLNNNELSYIKCLYYNYYYKKKYNYVIYRLSIINNKLHSGLFLTEDKNNNINYI